MKKVLVIFILFLAFQAGAQKFGYIITVNNTKETAATMSFRTQSIEEVQESILANTGLNLNVENIFEGDNLFFEYRNKGMFFYCEKKIVEQKKNGKLVYKKIKPQNQEELRPEQNQFAEDLKVGK